MSRFTETSVDVIGNAFNCIGKDWMLITTANGDKVNAMTASWGGLGVLWGQNVCTVYIRPQRYTYELIENSDTFSISFLSEKYRDALKLCGTLSGRDCDKLTLAGLSSEFVDKTPVICEADTVLVCRKLYCDDLHKDAFISDAPLSNYKDGDFHRFYICKIEKVLKRS